MFTRNQHDTPLFDGLKAYAAENRLPFHIPGHKKGRGMDHAFRSFLGQQALDIDLINIEPLDDLHHPAGIIHEAQLTAADAFGADYTFFSVQGTSGAIMTMIMSVCSPGDKLIVPRNVHKSIMSAVVFSGATPIFIHPDIDENLGISHGITRQAAARAVKSHPDAKGLLVINPTYFGYAADLQGIVETAHEAGMPVLVDEAHGVHIHFHEQLPLSAMQAGADLAATSVHKLGGSLTQSSILNVQGNLVSTKKVQAVMSMLTTTSTSYILLASLDAARRHLAVSGRDILDETIRLAEILRKEVSRIPGLYVPGSDILNSTSCYDYDVTKVTVSVKDLHITGHEAEVFLRRNCRIEVELSDLYNVLFLITPGDSTESINLLIEALAELSRAYAASGTWKDNDTPVEVPNIPILSYSPRDAFYADTETVPLSQAAGRISAEFIMIYPPGIPIFIPGEMIEQQNLDYIEKNIQSGLPVQGPEDETLEKIRVIQERKAIT
ncbi:aminotransferase class I/II-fold pyridoxal phosphate-dependent enzyme [Alkalicoccus chagannorensis]|uniref:aminotransferase class I/II-fold pyridoxal phosphate-dependent enzyme n=1 Tax=Alkalicoccus chagannorensis TaxID=427072 RepID=UPI00047B3D2D|nr:aminotransferase class I/II-fold pyridoxal phosphate-dependent enzyme [Alkalicoccus chagannorensis]